MADNQQEKPEHPPDYEEGGAGLGSPDGKPLSGNDPERENQDQISLEDTGADASHTVPDDENGSES